MASLKRSESNPRATVWIDTAAQTAVLTWAIARSHSKENDGLSEKLYTNIISTSALGRPAYTASIGQKRPIIGSTCVLPKALAQCALGRKQSLGGFSHLISGSDLLLFFHLDAGHIHNSLAQYISGGLAILWGLPLGA
jgi:hypothetical protein